MYTGEYRYIAAVFLKDPDIFEKLLPLSMLLVINDTLHVYRLRSGMSSSDLGDTMRRSRKIRVRVEAGSISKEIARKF